MKSSKKTDSFHTSDGPSSLGTVAEKNPHRACQAVSAKEKKKTNTLDPFANYGKKIETISSLGNIDSGA